MNRLNARIAFWFNVAEACIHPLCMDREGYKHAVAENHRYCDIARILGLEICTVTGRVNELTKEGLIKAWGRKTDPRTGKTVKVWKAI